MYNYINISNFINNKKIFFYMQHCFDSGYVTNSVLYLLNLYLFNFYTIIYNAHNKLPLFIVIQSLGLKAVNCGSSTQPRGVSPYGTPSKVREVKKMEFKKGGGGGGGATAIFTVNNIYCVFSIYNIITILIIKNTDIKSKKCTNIFYNGCYHVNILLSTSYITFMNEMKYNEYLASVFN